MNYKTIVVPIVATVYMGIELIVKHPISESTKTETVDIVTALVGTGVTLFGIVKNHKK
jgi:hypothetical protein